MSPWPKVKKFYSCNLWIFIMSWSLRIMSREFFRCATRTQPLWSKLAHIFFFIDQTRNFSIYQWLISFFYQQEVATKTTFVRFLPQLKLCDNKKISWSHIFLRLNNEISWRTIIAKPTQRRRQKDDATWRLKSSFLSSIEQCLLDPNAGKQ